MTDFRFTILVVPYMRRRREQIGLAGSMPERWQTLMDHIRTQMQFAESVGYDGFAMTEQHLQVEGIETTTNPLFWDYFVAQHTERMRVGQLGMNLTAVNPIQLAENIAMLDHFTGGRTFVGFSRGNTPRWTGTFGQHLGITSTESDKSDADQRNRRALYENWHLVKSLWTQDKVSIQGEFWQAPPEMEWHFPPTDDFDPSAVDANKTLREIGIVPRPLQQPHPPVYAPFSYSMETSKFWAREGGKMVSFVAPERQSFIGTALNIYLEEAHSSGRDTTAADALAIGGHLTMGRTPAEAADLYGGFEELFNWAYNAPPYVVPMGRVWRGSREQELDHVASLHTEFGVTEFFLWHHVGYFTQDQELAMLNEFAEGVIAPLRGESRGLGASTREAAAAAVGTVGSAAKAIAGSVARASRAGGDTMIQAGASAGRAIGAGTRRAFDWTVDMPSTVLSTAQALAASDLSAQVNDLVAAAVKGNATIYDKAMDAVFAETGIGGGYHRLFDGGHTIGGAFKAAHEAAPDDTLIQEALGAIKGLLRDVSTPRGLPLATWDKPTFDRVADSLQTDFGIPKSWFYDLNTYDAADLLGAAVGVASLVFGWNRADTRAFGRIAASIGMSAALSTNPLLMIVAVVAFGRAFHKAEHEDAYDDLAQGAFAGAAGAAATIGAVAFVGMAGGSAGVALLAGVTAGVLAHVVTSNVDVGAVCDFIKTETATIIARIAQMAVVTGDVVAESARTAGGAAVSGAKGAGRRVTDGASAAGRHISEGAAAAGRLVAEGADTAKEATRRTTEAIGGAASSTLDNAKSLFDRSDTDNNADAGEEHTDADERSSP